MKYYIVKHGSNDWRTHLQDGTELGTHNSRPSAADAYADVAEHLGLTAGTASAIGELLANEFASRNLTISDETVPWQ